MKVINGILILLTGIADAGTPRSPVIQEECGCPIPTVTCVSRLDAFGCSHLVCNGIQGEYIETNRCPSGAYDVHTINPAGCGHFVAYDEKGNIINEGWSPNCTQMISM